MNLVIQNNANGQTACCAEKELKKYIRKYSGAEFSGEPALRFCLETAENLEPHCYSWEKSGNTVTLRGGSESALLCCVYEALSAMGVCFTTEGDSLKGPFRPDAVTGNRTFAPYCRNRGIRQHINFPMDISSYSLKEAKEYIRNLARMRMNAITFHSYNGQWHPYRKDGQRVPAGHFFYGQRHSLPSRPETAAAIQNRRAFCIPEAEAVLDEPDKREQFAVYWLNEVMNTAKEVGMKVTLSIECQESTPLEAEKEMVTEALRLYPQIDVIELITPEGGGDDSRQITGEEALAFLRAVGPEQVFCAVRNAEALGLRPQAAGDVLRRQVPAGEALQPPGEVNIRELYGLLEETGMVEEFEPFYLDLSHKLRHGGAVALTRRQEGELAGCAVVSAISRKAAVLSAVAVGEHFRRQGMGSALVRQAEACLPGKNVYVFREKEKNQEFYRKLGYSKIDTWVQARL